MRTLRKTKSMPNQAVSCLDVPAYKGPRESALGRNPHSTFLFMATLIYKSHPRLSHRQSSSKFLTFLNHHPQKSPPKHKLRRDPHLPHKQNAVRVKPRPYSIGLPLANSFEAEVAGRESGGALDASRAPRSSGSRPSAQLSQYSLPPRPKRRCQ